MNPYYKLKLLLNFVIVIIYSLILIICIFSNLQASDIKHNIQTIMSQWVNGETLLR